MDPRSTSPGSIMPTYPWLYENELSTSLTSSKLAAMKSLGVPYSDEQIRNAVADLKTQAQAIADGLSAQGMSDAKGKSSTEIIALIAYMQRLGTDIKSVPRSKLLLE